MFGWSPEIAAEKGNKAYLSHGDANPFAIIVSPEQANSRVFFPYHNFDQVMMQHVYSTYQAQIQELTQYTAVMVDVDRYIIALQNPLDLLDYHKITLGFSTVGNYQQVQEEQVALVDSFHKDDNFLNIHLHQKILASVKQHGDLRSREVMMKKMGFDVSTFFTRAFGGVYIVREDAMKPLLILADREQYDAIPNKRSYDALLLEDVRDVVPALEERGFLAINLAEYVEGARLYSRLERIAEYLFVSVIAQHELQHDIMEILSNRSLHTRYVQKHKDKLSVYLEFEKVRKAIGDGDMQPLKKLSPDIYMALLHPNYLTDEVFGPLMWHLLGAIHGVDVFMLYKYNKEAFYARYQQWPEAMQTWAIATIVKYNF